MCESRSVAFGFAGGEGPNSRPGCFWSSQRWRNDRRLSDSSVLKVSTRDCFYLIVRFLGPRMYLTAKSNCEGRTISGIKGEELCHCPPPTLSYLQYYRTVLKFAALSALIACVPAIRPGCWSGNPWTGATTFLIPSYVQEVQEAVGKFVLYPLETHNTYARISA